MKTLDAISSRAKTESVFRRKARILLNEIRFAIELTGRAYLQGPAR
ncbi:hypothetical protein [Massilia putida]|nr:hypothetical protein [Massilia putida]